jgi:hypothetical protein
MHPTSIARRFRVGKPAFEGSTSLDLRSEALVRYRLSTAAYSYAEETISSPLSGAGGFGPLGPTSFRSSRYTFRIAAARLGVGGSRVSPNSPGFNWARS